MKISSFFRSLRAYGAVYGAVSVAQAVTFFSCVFCSGFAAADYIAPGDVHVKTAAYTPQHTGFARGAYHYSVSWQGIPVGSAQIYIRDRKREEEKPYLFVEAKAQTNKAIGIFYSLDHTSTSLFRADTLLPVRFETEEVANSREKSREIDFESDGRVVAIIGKDGKETERIEFLRENNTLDPISAAFLARSLPIDIGTSETFDVFNGKHRFLITFEVLGREPLEIAGKTWDTFKVRPLVKKLTDTEGEKKFKSATLWISADERREVLKIKSEVMIGSVTAELEDYTETPNIPGPEIRTAQADDDKPAASARGRMSTLIHR